MATKSTKIANDNAITLSELQEELRVRWDLPFSVFVSGPAGVGKSAVFKQLVAEIATGDRFAKWTFKNGIEVCGKDGNEFGFIDYRLAQIEPQDLAGIPMPENGTTRRFLPSELPVVGNDTVPEQGLLFLDEANQADITVQKAMFSLILDRKVAGIPLKPGWRVMAAGNRLEDSIAVSEMAAPLQNRFVHYTVRADYNTWKDWAMATKMHPSVFAFVQNNIQHFCKSHGDNDEYAFPTPRTWEQVALTVKYWESRNIKKNHAQKVRSIAAIIGRSAAELYTSFLEAAQAIDVEALLSGRVKVEYTSADIAKAWHCVSALYSYVLRKNTLEDTKKVILFIIQSDTFKALKEFMAMLIHDLNIYDRKRMAEVYGSLQGEELDETYKILSIYLKAKQIG